LYFIFCFPKLNNTLLVTVIYNKIIIKYVPLFYFIYKEKMKYVVGDH
jgi:hypothetical protein